MPSAKVSVTSHGAVVLIEINRPQVRNAVDNETAEALAHAFRDFEADPQMRLAVFAGRGSTFCAGADLREMANGQRRKRWKESFDGPMGPTRLALSKPVIAAIEGHAVAGGLELALWCDLRIAADDATFGVFNRRWGVPLLDGGTVRLPRLIGTGRALDIIMTGRAVSAAEALRIGLVSELTASGEAVQRAMDLAQSIATLPQEAMNLDRQSVLRQDGRPLAEAMADEFQYGLATEGVESGAARFVAGAGRHGAPTSADGSAVQSKSNVR